MEFVGVKEMSQRTSALINRKDWIVITKNGKPVKILMDIDADDLEDMILAKHCRLEQELKRAVRDAKRGGLKTLSQALHAPRRKAA